jgi:glucose/arabinose dehydrogenase
MLSRRTVLLTGAAAGTASAIAPALLAAPADAAVRVSKILAHDLVVPWGLAFLPNGDALVGERISGRVHRVSAAGGRRHVGTIDEVVPAGEAGLLGIAVAPTFTQDRWVYFYVSVAHEQRIIRKRYAGGQLGPTQVVLPGIPRGETSNHNGGGLGFGPDGLLYASTGDARLDTPGQKSGSVAQDPHSLAGKILRLAPDGSVPDGNPWGNHVWTVGHRNVEGFTWNAQGEMWATEFGENTRDELNRIVPGANCGWPAVEGGDGPGGFHDPFVTWHPTDTCSPSGVAISKGRAWVGALQGRCLFSVRLTGPHAGQKVRHLGDRFGRIRTVRRAPDGSLWITTSNRDGRGTPAAADDRVIRLVL